MWNLPTECREAVLSFALKYDGRISEQLWTIILRFLNVTASNDVRKLLYKFFELFLFSFVISYEMIS